jgi:hypothetical protein
MVPYCEIPNGTVLLKNIPVPLRKEAAIAPDWPGALPFPP